MSQKNLLRVIREFVAISGVAELVLATFVGFQFGAGESVRAWVFTGILAALAYTSTRAWIYYFDNRVKGENDADTCTKTG